MNTTMIDRSRAKSVSFAALYGIRAGKSTLKSIIDLHTSFPLSALTLPSPSYPGGAKRFCSLMNAWTRDMTGPGGLKHEFVQIGPHVFCSRCRLSVARFCETRSRPLEIPNAFGEMKMTYKPRIDGLNPQKLRVAVRMAVESMGSCELQVVKNVMDS